MKRILVVDDNKDILVVVQLVLELRGYKVMTIFKGTEVIPAIKDFSPDVILLDIYLDTLNGIDLCNEIKSNKENEHICIIMFSAHAKGEDVLKQCPANAFISKPFDVHHLAETIEAQFGKCD